MISNIITTTFLGFQIKITTVKFSNSFVSFFRLHLTGCSKIKRPNKIISNKAIESLSTASAITSKRFVHHVKISTFNYKKTITISQK